jgi:glucose uptake protein GlcU
VCFGLYVLPRRHSHLDPWAYSAAMGLVVAALGGAAWLGLAWAGQGALGPAALRRCALSGAIWAGSNVAYVLAIDRAGVARANALKNTTALFATAFGLLAGERLLPGQAAAAVAGSALIVAAALLLGAAPRAPTAGEAPRPGTDALGVLAGLAAAAGIGYYLVPALPVVQAGPWGWLRYQAALGVFGGLANAAPHAIRLALGRARGIPRRELGPPVLAGCLWFAGSALVTPATPLVGLAISWPLSQLSFYLTLLWGVAVYREVDLGRARGAVWAGAACTLAALVLFGLARA